MGSLSKTYSDEKLAGRVYTPPDLVARILDLAGYAGAAGARVLDPACGDGQFLVEVVRRILDATPRDRLPEALRAVHGWDLDAEAVAACRQRLDALVAPHGVAVDWNVRVRNALDAHRGGDLFAAGDGAPGEAPFDFVVGNPPYVRIQHLSEADRAVVQSRFRFCASGSTDLYVAFFELALGLLAPGGVLAYVTPNTYFHTATGRALRRHLAEGRRLRHVVNFGHRQVFPEATTYAAITVAANEPAPGFTYVDASEEPERAERVEASWLAGRDVWRFGCDAESLDPERYRPLREIARVHVGIATLADPVFVVEEAASGSGETVRVRTKPFGEVEIERGLLRPAIKGSKVKVGAPCHRGLHVVFPYETARGKPRLIPEDALAARYPLGYAYLTRARTLLDRRDNGRPNPQGWYAFGRTQALATAFGEKIVCPPMAKDPTFVVCRMAEATVYSGYFVKYDGDLDALARQLNSERMRAFVQAGGRDYLGGWKGYSKAAIQDFPVDTAAL